jgi:hypothetical protein
VTQLDEVAEIEPHGPLPLAVRKSVIVPQLVNTLVITMFVVPCEARVPMELVIRVTVLFALVIVSMRVTPVSGAVPQLLTVPETVNEPATMSMSAGPQDFVTAIQAVLLTTVTQFDEVAEIEPHGPFPLAVRKSVIVPQVVSTLVITMLVVACEAKVPIALVIRLTLPFALVTVSTRVTPVRAAEPQLLTVPETVNDPAAMSMSAGPHALVTVMQAVLPTAVVQV